jgi:hypothetical protein
VAGTGAGLLRGKNLEDSVKAGLTQAIIAGTTTGLTKGFSANSASYDLNNPNQPDSYLDQTGGADSSSVPSADSSGTGVDSGATTGVTNDIRYQYDGKEISASQAKALAERGLYPTVVSNARSATEAAARSSAAPAAYPFQNNAAQDMLANSKLPPVGNSAVDNYLTGNKTSLVPATSTSGSTSELRGTRDFYSRGRDFSGSSVQDVSGAVLNKPTGFQFTNASGAISDIAGAPKPLIPVNDFGQGAIDNTPPPVEISGPPTYGDAAGNIYGGLKQMLPGTQGRFGEGYEQFTKGIGQLYSPSLSNAELKNTAEYQSAIDSGKTIGASLKEAAEANAPGIIRSYGPGTATALGATYALGGFDVPERPKSEQQTEMESRYKTQKADVAASPGTYTPQGLGRFGIKYNDKGEIIGGSSYSLTPLNPTEVPSMPYVPYTPKRYAAAGGIASLAAGGYPRRTGQISGPGTATSDSIPAMLSDGEFVMTAKAVRGAGKGSRLAGAKKMYSLMHQLERNASRK